ncbi:MAG: GNAT family N-acetyltransferase [Promethearchaeota archaeon]
MNLKANEITLLESLSFSAWPAHEFSLFDGWVLRFAEGYTKRSNSVSPLYPGAIPLNSKIEYCSHEYTSRGLPLIFKLTDLPHALEIDKWAVDKGFEKLDETSVQTLSLINIDPILKSTPQRTQNIQWKPTLDKKWLDSFIALNPQRGFNPAEQSAMVGILQSIQPPHWFYQIYLNDDENNQCVGAGLGVLQVGYYGISDIVVHPNHRRQGIATQLIQGMLSHARQEGGHTAYLQVVKSNVPAVDLYAKLGFSELYRYWYRRELGKQ